MRKFVMGKVFKKVYYVALYTYISIYTNGTPFVCKGKSRDYLGSHSLEFC